MTAQRPDFVMVGGQQDGKVYLLASKTLTEVELRMERDRLDNRYGWPKPWGPERHFVTAEMRDYVMVVGDSYAEAFRTLFEEWSPEPEPRPAIDGLRAVTQRARNIAYHDLGIDSGPPAIDAPPRALPPG
ncbi:hypothetical protein SEA_PAITO_55 [Mycobacterium phage Paito]|uniref:Uncharacterized protein n=1 Tax=Mycobacterium phage Paito TaxID=2315544 RepID=A0A386KIC0_9CAUD|nr:hypothetical protein KDW68_gp55 [Mycobacterium phage Paito]AYD84639.1 hypothetical protein SEA_PAITO_55 [Mycobacterium phage Paito]